MNDGTLWGEVYPGKLISPEVEAALLDVFAAFPKLTIMQAYAVAQRRVNPDNNPDRVSA